MMKLFLKAAAAGIVLGLLLVAVRGLFQIHEAAFRRFYWTAGIAVVAGAILLNLLYNGSYQKKMRQAAALLEQGKADSYIEAVEKLLETARGRGLRNLLLVNLSVGYCERKQFDRAIELLEGLPGERLPGILKSVHRFNLCLCYFYTRQEEKADALYHTGSREWARLQKIPSMGGNLAVLELFAAISDGQYEKAKGLLEEARKNWNRPRLQDDFQYIESLLEKQQER